MFEKITITSDVFFSIYLRIDLFLYAIFKVHPVSFETEWR